MKVSSNNLTNICRLLFSISRNTDNDVYFLDNEILDSLLNSYKRLDFKDDAIMKTPFHSHFLFSDICFASRNQLLCSTDRFLTKFTVPEYEANKKATKVCYLELNEIVGIQELGYSSLTRSYNNHFIAVGSYDGSVSIRKSNNLVSF